VKLSREIKYYYLKYKRTKDTPKSIARGIAMGISLDFFPTFGLGLILAFFIAGLFKANRPAAVLAAIAGKWAIPFFYYLNYKIGKLFTGMGFVRYGAFDPKMMFQVINFKNLSYAFLVGSFINGIVVALVTYYVVLKFTTFWSARKAN